MRYNQVENIIGTNHRETMDYTTATIFDKTIYIFKDHATAILPWQKISTALARLPYLITLDHHHDTKPAFLRNAYAVHGDNNGKCELYREQLYEKVKCEGFKSAAWALSLLNNDEHIDFAIKAGIISHSFSIQYLKSFGTPSNEKIRYGEEPKEPFTYSLPENKMFIVPHVCAIGCDKNGHDDECLILHANQAIESIYLKDQLRKIYRMNITSGLGRLTKKTPPYILDIDLDYFRTKKAISPDDTTIFYELIKNASAITIAEEPSCVKQFRLESSLSSNFLLKSLLRHIENALRKS